MWAGSSGACAASPKSSLGEGGYRANGFDKRTAANRCFCTESAPRSCETTVSAVLACGLAPASPLPRSAELGA